MRPVTSATFFATIPCAVLVAFTTLPFHPVACLASPVSMPLPMPLMGHMPVNHTSDVLVTRNSMVDPVLAGGTIPERRPPMFPRRVSKSMSEPMAKTMMKPKPVVKPMSPMRGSSSSMMASHATLMQRQADFLSGLSSYNDQIQSYKSNFSNLAATSSSGAAADALFQQSTAYQMTSLHASLLGINNLFSAAAADKGLANYNKMDQVQTTLKDSINTIKDLLSNTDVIVYNVPLVGPILGPIVYDIKCILDSILDTTENLTDGLLNALDPLLQGLIGQATDTTCATGLKIAGLCL